MAKRLDLEEADVNLLTQVLIQRPFAEVNNLIQKIVGQMNDQGFQARIEELEKSLVAAQGEVADLKSRYEPSAKAA